MDDAQRQALSEGDRRMHGERVTLRPAEPDDAEGIVSVFREAMPEVVVALNVLGMPEAPAFVRHSIEASTHGGDNRFWVAVEPGRGVVGFAQLRHGLRTAVINNLHVAPGHQGMGIGEGLMRLLTAGVAASEVRVDTFEDSAVSRALFGRIGFVPISTHHWHVRELAAGPVPEFVVQDLPQADVVHAAFGISTLRVETRTGIHLAGRMGDRLFRVTSTAAVQDESLLAALAALDPGRSVLAIMDARHDPLPGPPRLVSIRLHASLDLLSAKYGV
jgi:ribosomal protein S18 acetylase RimI-like enzyme